MDSTATGKCASVLVDGFTCGEPGELYSSFYVCDLHLDMLRVRNQTSTRLFALQTSKYHELDKFPGFCYIALLPDGNVKIGYSNTEKLLEGRMKSLSRQYQAHVLPLAVIAGGFVAEAVLHDKFKEDRLSGNGERFKYTAQIAEYIASLENNLLKSQLVWDVKSSVSDGV